MDKRRNANLSEFRELLELAIDKAGTTFIATERLSEKLHGRDGAHGVPLKAIAKSTLHDHVRGSRPQGLPPWTWVANLWAVLTVAAAENKIDPVGIGTLHEWQEVYEATKQKLRRLGKEGAEFGTSMTEPRASWWRLFADFVPPWFEQYLNLEPLAVQIRCFEERFIPELLQTEEYAEAVLRLRFSQASDAEVARRVELVKLRQELEPYQGRAIWSLIGENVLRQSPVGPAVTKRQLEHLLELSPSRPIRVVPDGVAARQSATGPITMLCFNHKFLPDAIYLEQSDGALYPTEATDQALYRRQFNSLELAAYRLPASRALIRQHITEL